MSIRWQVFFASISGTKYRVDIYDKEYFGTPVILQAGEQPFVTNESDSDDYFDPIRAQSGTLQVCTALSNGGHISIEELLPSNNIERPVRLVNLSSNNSIEWCGFLSCEAYSQSYTAIPENISLSLIGMLEAMDSVYVKAPNFGGVLQGNILLHHIISRFNNAVGLSMITNVAYSQTAWRALLKYYDTSTFFEIKEIANVNTTTYEPVGISCKEALERLCSFLGWTARENATTIYLARLNEDLGMYSQTLGSLNSATFYDNRSQFPITNKGIIEMDWRGDSHKIDARQGARSVEIIASLSNYKADLSLPDFPNNKPTSSYTKVAENNNNGDRTNKYIENVLEQDDSAVSICSYAYHYGYCYRLDGGTPIYRYDGASTQSAFITNSFLRGGKFSRTEIGSGESVFYAGAALIKYAVKSSSTEAVESYDEGLYCTFLPGISEPLVEPIFKMRTPAPVSLSGGRLSLKGDAYFLGIVATKNWLSYAAFQEGCAMFNYHPMLMLKLRIGDMYWNGGQWTDIDSYFIIIVGDSGIDLQIPVPAMLFGEAELSIYPQISAGELDFNNASQVFEILFKTLELSYSTDGDISMVDRSSNHYYRNLDTNFRDEISRDVKFASYLNNIPSPSIIITDPNLNSANRFAQNISYQRNGYQVSKRPEIDLLERFADYYSRARLILNLEAAHIETPLPLLSLNGIDDGKVYSPMAESREWQLEKSAITCMEYIDNNS